MAVLTTTPELRMHSSCSACGWEELVPSDAAQEDEAFIAPIYSVVLMASSHPRNLWYPS